MRKHRYFVILVILLCSIADLKGVNQPSFRYLPRCHPISDVKALPTLCGPGTNLGLLILGLFYILAVTLEPQCAEATVGSKRKNPSSAKQKSPATKRSWKGFKEGEPEPPMLPEEIMEPLAISRMQCKEDASSSVGWLKMPGWKPALQDPRGVMEMLLMMAGDVEPNPGPNIWVQVQGVGQPMEIEVSSGASVSKIVQNDYLSIPASLVSRVNAKSMDGSRVIPFSMSVEDVLDSDIGTSAECALLLIEPEVPAAKKPRMSVKQPTLVNHSPSDFATHTSLHNSQIHEAPLFSHWFAIKLYNHFKGPSQFEKNASDKDLVSVEQSFKKIASIPSKPTSVGRGIMSNQKLKTAELSLTALYARALDRFLFPDELVDAGACLHQLPVKREGSAVQRADLQVAILRDGYPYEPVLLSDVKQNNLQTAIKETDAYAITVANVVNEYPSYTVHLGLPVSDTTAKLLLLVGDYGLLREITICEAHFDSGDSKAFFATLFAAVHFLISCPIHKFSAGMEPIQQVADLQVLDHHNGRNCRVFKSNGTVYKLYDTELTPSRLPNIEVIQSIDTNYLPDLLLKPLTVDERVMCLQYTYIPGDHTPRSIDQFVCIVNSLKILHEKNYVHSDIRDVNLVFSESSKEAWIIDFDLAGEVGTHYPSTYACNISVPERHKAARAFCKRQTKHDMFALSEIIKSFCPSIEENTIDQLQKCNYSMAAALLLEHKCSVHKPSVV